MGFEAVFKDSSRSGRLYVFWLFVPYLWGGMRKTSFLKKINFFEVPQEGFL